MMLDITVQLNTNITNEISDARVVKLEDEATPHWLPGWRNCLDANDLTGHFAVNG